MAHLEPRDEPCRVVARWDDDGRCLDVQWEPVESQGAAPAPTLSRRIDMAVGVHEPEPRATLGPVDMTLDRHRRVCGVSWRTSPSAWKPAAADMAAAHAPEVWLVLDLDFDSNYIASFAASLTERWDPVARTLHLAWGDQAARRWGCLAPGVWAGLSDSGALVALQFHRLDALVPELRLPRGGG